LLYDVIDQSGGFYLPHAERDSRSMMNVPFRLANTAHDEPFLKQAAERGLVELKGHRSVGGCRASIYNAMPVEGVKLLADFMKEFAAKNA
jgi:phosphoserine aminotransferase